MMLHVCAQRQHSLSIWTVCLLVLSLRKELYKLLAFETFGATVPLMPRAKALLRRHMRAMAALTGL